MQRYRCQFCGEDSNGAFAYCYPCSKDIANGIVHDQGHPLRLYENDWAEEREVHGKRFNILFWGNYIEKQADIMNYAEMDDLTVMENLLEFIQNHMRPPIKPKFHEFN